MYYCLFVNEKESKTSQTGLDNFSFRAQTIRYVTVIHTAVKKGASGRHRRHHRLKALHTLAHISHKTECAVCIVYT